MIIEGTQAELSLRSHIGCRNFMDNSWSVDYEKEYTIYYIDSSGNDGGRLQQQGR